MDAAADEPFEEPGERRLRHLAGRHFEFPMAYLAAAHRMSADLYIVGRIADDHLCNLAVEQSFVGFSVQGITADQTMSPQLPNVTELAQRGTIDRKPRQIVGRIGGVRLGRAVHQQVDLSGREAGELDIEIELDQVFEVTSQ